LKDKDAQVMDVTQAAQQGFIDTLQAQLGKTVWADPNCNSWYKNAKGQITQNWGASCREYATAVRDVVWSDYQLS
jgi:hypothetical protein